MREMQIFIDLLRVIFVLSTIVAVTDCCSSRILLLREQTINFLEEQLQNFENVQQHPDPKMVNLAMEKYFRKNLSLATQIPPLQNPLQLNIDNSASGMPTVTSPTLNMETAAESTLLYSTDITAIEQATDVPNELKSTAPYESAHIDAKASSDFFFTIFRDILATECNGQFRTDFCLNKGRCFRYPIGNHSFYSCECADGYVGERCESKSLNGFYTPTHTLEPKKPKILMARMVFSFPMLIALSVIHIIWGALIVLKRPKKLRSAGLVNS